MVFHSIIRSGLLVAAALVGGALTGCAPEAPADQARVITVWAHHGQEAENTAMRAIVDAFNAAHQGELRVDIQFFPGGQYANKVSIASAADRLPDVLEIDGPLVGPWAAEGLLLPLNAHATPEYLADFLPTVVAQGTFNERLYALGAFDSALVVYYNRDIIARAGLDPPQRLEEAWSWPQFVAALHQVQPYADLPLSLHLDDPGDEWFTYAFSPLIWSNGGALIDDGRTEGVLDGPAAVEAIGRWRELITAGLAEPTSTNPNPFTGGRTAFDWTGHWMLPSFEAATDLDFGVMPLPRMGPEVVAPCGSWCWGISRSCRNRNDAWRVIAWLLDPAEGVKPIVQANGAVPARYSAFRFFPEYDVPPRRLFREQLEHAARPRPRTPVYPALTSAFARALRDIAFGAKVQPTLEHAARRVQRDLNRQAAGDAARKGGAHAAP